MNFKKGIFNVVATLDNGSILFDAETVAKSLGITQHKNGVEYVRWERVNEYLPNSPVVGKGDFIPEAAVYKLAFKASNTIAEQFQDWLAIEVVPSIRQNGGYIATTEDDDESTIMAKALLVAQRTIEKNKQKILQQQQQLEEQKPKVEFAEAVWTTEKTILIRELAKLISQAGYKIGEKALFLWLRENGYLIKKVGLDYNTPTAKSINMGIMQYKESSYTTSEGQQIAKTPRVTGKGQVYFISKFQELAKASS